MDTEEQDAATAALTEWLRRLRTGQPIGQDGLVLVPLYRDGHAEHPTYQPLAAAIAAGEVEVAEAPQAQVPTLHVTNHGGLPVLIMDGEEVVGGRQNRVVNTSLLVPPHTTFPLPVSCVEHGRWHETRTTFDVGEAIYPTLRHDKLEQVSASFRRAAAPLSDQGAVWEEIADRQARTHTRSATASLHDSYTQRAAALDAAEQALPYPTEGPLGVVALVAGRPTCADIFDSPRTLRQYWRRLVRSYGLEAADSEAADDTPAARPPDRGAQDLLRRAGTARLSPFRSPGLGIDVRLSGSGVDGAALVHDGVVVHTALFRRRQRATATTSIRRPAERARRLTR